MRHDRYIPEVLPHTTKYTLRTVSGPALEFAPVVGVPGGVGAGHDLGSGYDSEPGHDLGSGYDLSPGHDLAPATT